MLRFLALLLLPLVAIAQPFVWTTFTSTSDAIDATEYNGRIWIATTGGLSGYDPASNTFDVYTNTRGLAMNHCVAVSHDSKGWIWVALFDGRISRMNPQTGATRQIVELQNDVFEITDICMVRDEMFVSANNGIYRFFYSDLDSNFHVRESIKVLKDFPGETRVSKLAVVDTFLYAATNIGLARASINTSYLSPPAAWTNFTTSNSNLPQNSINALFSLQGGRLWISTPSFVCMLSGDVIQAVSPVGGIIDFKDVNDILYATSQNQVYRADGSSWTSFGASLPKIVRLCKLDAPALPTKVAISYDKPILVVGDDPSTTPGGLVFWEDSTWSQPFSAPGIGGNFIESLAVDPKGRLWAGASGSSQGVYRYDNPRWKNFIKSAEHPQGYLVAGAEAFAFDDYGGTWVASQGNGVLWFHEDSLIYFNYDSTNGFDNNGPRLVGIGDDNLPDRKFVVARVTRDDEGNIYISNRLSFRNQPLIRVSAQWIARGNNSDPWNYYSQPGPVSSSNCELQEIIVDPFHRIWLGACYDNVGSCWVFDDRGTPTDTAADRWTAFLPRNYEDAAFTCFNDINGQVLDWEIDHQGYLWVATPEGAYYTQAGIPQSLSSLKFICVADMPFGHQINDIHVDAQDNKWFATDAGVCVLDKNFSWIHRFKTASSVDYPSDLISNNALAVTSNPATGDIWIGTADGLSRLSSPYLSKGGSLDELWPYPNPYRADGTLHMFIDHQRLGGKFDDLRIFTISGRLVRKLSWSQMIDPNGGWDGRNESGDFVAGGVYLLKATSDDGKSVTGKIAVLGR